MMFRPMANNRLIKVMFRSFVNIVWCSRQPTLGAGILNDFGDQACPTSLMRRADSTACVAVKVLEKKEVIAEVWIMIHFAV